MSTGDPRVVTTRAAFTGTARGQQGTVRVPVEVHVPVADPFEAYRRARPDSGGVYLETTGGQDGWGYFATDPIERLQVGPSLTPVGDADPAPSIAELVGRLDAETLVRGDCDVPYPCGAVGWLSYDVARDLEDLPDTTVDDRGLPRLQAAVFDRVAAWKEPRNGETTLRVTACPRVGGDPTAAYERGRSRALELARQVRAGDPSVAAPGRQADTATFESDCSPAEFHERVRTVKEYVRDGDTFQANVSQRLRAPAAVHPVEAYAALRAVNPAPYSALVEFPGADLVSASPELLLDVEPDGSAARVLTEPIAGTRPRGDTPEADADLERDLLTDEKERAEHAMLVDLERNDLGKVCRYGSVSVPEYRRVDRYSEVMHLVSLVEGRLGEGRDLGDAVGAVFPGGTITGAPKPRTMEIIDEVEASRRGPYTGSIGLFGFDGRATLNIIIRTLVRRQGEYFLRVGAGIVHDSVPEREYEETLDKGRALVRALDEALGERTTLAVESQGVAD
jgi:anthranilate synthase component 1